MRVMVLGGTGGLGLACVERAHAAGHSVRVMARSPGRVTLPDGVERIVGDVARADEQRPYAPISARGALRVEQEQRVRGSAGPAYATPSSACPSSTDQT